MVVDSTGERSGLHSLPGLLAREPTRSVTDLSWTKLTGWRELVARLFDPPKAARALARLDRIELTHAGRSQAQARLLAAWVLSRTGRHPSVELTSETRRDMRSGSLIGVRLTCGKERYEVVRLGEGVAEVRSPHLEPQQARLWVPHLPALVAEELGHLRARRGVRGGRRAARHVNLDVSPGPDAAIERLCELIAGAAPRSLVLTGGTTAGAAYELLASEGWRARLDWSRVTLYFGDERRVPPDDEGSCYRLVRRDAAARRDAGRASSACAARSPTATPRPTATARSCPTGST